MKMHKRAGSGPSPRTRRQLGRTAEADTQVRSKAGTRSIDTRGGELPFAAAMTNGGDAHTVSAGTVTVVLCGWQHLLEAASGRHDFTPLGRRPGAECSQCAAGNQMTLDVEVVGDGGVGGEEALRRSGRPKSNLLPLSASGRLMRNLCSVVGPAAGHVPVGQVQLSQGCAVRSKPIRHDRTGNIALALKQFSKQFQRGLPVPLRLDQDVKYFALVIHRAPQIYSLAADLEENPVQVPSIRRLWSASSNTLSVSDVSAYGTDLRFS